MKPADSIAALLFILSICTLQTSAGEDLYWEGEDDGANGYLEIKDSDSFLGGHLKRLKRQWSWWSPFDTTTKAEEPVTEDPARVDDESPSENDFDGSGLREPERLEPSERTVRVTFVVIQPYQKDYSDRDSDQFRTFSKTLSDEVNKLYYNLPGTQKATLVRIQSRISDNFSCKVTLDIVTTGYDDTDRIADMLRDHIRTRRSLGNIGVSDADFSAKVVDPGEILTIETCAADELQCDDGQCVPGFALCNRLRECNDGSDEANCVDADHNPPRGDQTLEIPSDTTETGTESQQLETDWPDQNTEENGNDDFSTSLYEGFTTPSAAFVDEPENNFTCPSNEFKCDITRCVALYKRCDNYADCDDGTDEQDCDLSTVRPMGHT